MQVEEADQSKTAVLNSFAIYAGNKYILVAARSVVGLVVTRAVTVCCLLLLFMVVFVYFCCCSSLLLFFMVYLFRS